MQFYHERDLRGFEAHPFQFNVWRYSGKSRVIVDFAMTIILSTVMHIVITYVLRYAPQMKDAFNKFLILEQTW